MISLHLTLAPVFNCRFVLFTQHQHQADSPNTAQTLVLFPLKQ